MIGLDHVQVAAPVGSEQVARSFYGGLLGLPEVVKPAALHGRGGVWFTVGGSGLHIGVEPGFKPARKAHPAFRLASAAALDAVVARLREAGHGIDTDVELPGLVRVCVHDPFGNRLELVAPR